MTRRGSALLLVSKGRMALTMEAHDLPRPLFEEVGSEFRVRLMGPGDRFMEELTVQPAWAEGLNERQVEAVLYVREHGRITNREYQTLFRVSHDTACRDLRGLLEKGLVEQRGRGRGIHYIPAI